MSIPRKKLPTINNHPMLSRRNTFKEANIIVRKIEPAKSEKVLMRGKRGSAHIKRVKPSELNLSSIVAEETKCQDDSILNLLTHINI